MRLLLRRAVPSISRRGRRAFGSTETYERVNQVEDSRLRPLLPDDRVAPRILEHEFVFKSRTPNHRMARRLVERSPPLETESIDFSVRVWVQSALQATPSSRDGRSI
jgi:hypothetical protein